MTALKETGARVRFQKVDRGRDVYHAHIFVADQMFGFVTQRRGGPYQACLRNGRLIGETDSLTQLREQVERYAAESVGQPPSIS